MPSTKAKRMSPEHFEKMQKGRAEGVIVRRYLSALHGESETPRRDVSGQLERIQDALDKERNQLKRVQLLKRKYDLEHGTVNPSVSIDEAEQDFIKIVNSYSERNQIVKDVWLEAGVPDSVLAAAGI